MCFWLWKRLHCKELLSQIANRNLSDVTEAEMFMDKVMCLSFIHVMFSRLRQLPSSLMCHVSHVILLQAIKLNTLLAWIKLQISVGLNIVGATHPSYLYDWIGGLPVNHQNYIYHHSLNIMIVHRFPVTGAPDLYCLLEVGLNFKQDDYLVMFGYTLQFDFK